MESGDDVRHQYEVERELAARLRAASRAERLRLYREVYDERIARVPAHPLVLRSSNRAAVESAVTRRLRLLRPFLHAGSRALEIGPGDGSLASAVATYVQRLYAVDVSLALVRATTWPENLEWRLTEGVSVPLPSESVDFAYSDQVLEHLHPDDALEQTANVYRALRAGGSYLCITPHRFTGPWDVSRAFAHEATGLHLKEYTLGELVRLLRAAGFERVRGFLSVGGRRLSPVVDARLFVGVEQVLAPLPRPARRRLARVLDAVKIVAAKLPPPEAGGPGRRRPGLR